MARPTTKVTNTIETDTSRSTKPVDAPKCFGKHKDVHNCHICSFHRECKNK